MMAQSLREKFKDKVKIEVKKISNKKRAEYLRRCALQALPYLCSKGHMNFWDEEDRHKHLYAILNALDGCRAMQKLNEQYRQRL